MTPKASRTCGFDARTGGSSESNRTNTCLIPISFQEWRLGIFFNFEIFEKKSKLTI